MDERDTPEMLAAYRAHQANSFAAFMASMELDVEDADEDDEPTTCSSDFRAGWLAAKGLA